MKEEVIKQLEDLSHIKLAIYSRVSTTRQGIRKKGNAYVNQKSLSEQLSLCLDWAEKRKLIIKKYFVYYSGEEKSGGHIVDHEFPEQNRDDLRDILRHLASLKHDYKELYLLSYSVSRLTRNIDDAKAIFKFCSENNIILCFANNNLIVSDNDTKETFFKEVIKSQKFLEELPSYIKVGQEQVKEQGKHPYGTPSFGMEVNDVGYLVKSESEHEIKTMAKKMYNLGYTYSKISETFNSRGYKSKSKKTWTVAMVRNIIQKRLVDFEVKEKFKIYRDSFKTKNIQTIDLALFSLIRSLSKLHEINICVFSENSCEVVKKFDYEIKEVFKMYIKEIIDKRSNKLKRKTKALELIKSLKELHCLLLNDIPDQKEKVQKSKKV